MFTTVTLGLLGIVLVVFGGLSFWKKSDHYRIVFATSVIGLEPGAQVYLNGIKVGTVDEVDVAAADIRGARQARAPGPVDRRPVDRADEAS